MQTLAEPIKTSFVGFFLYVRVHNAPLFQGSFLLSFMHVLFIRKFMSSALTSLVKSEDNIDTN